MATSSGPLEDHITCCVCIDVYHDPQALKCLHSLCRKCLNPLEKHDRVQCPECQEFTDMVDVRKDFKTEALVDLYNNKAIVSAPKKRKFEARQNKLCEMCGSEDNPITCKCNNCKQFMCEMCEEIHEKRKTETCKNHKITPIQDIVEMAQAKMRTLLQLLTSENDDMSKKSSDIDEMIRDIKNKGSSQVESIKQNQEEIINKIESHCEELINTVKKSGGDSITNLVTMKKHFTQSEKELQSHMQFLNNMIESQNTSVFTAETGQKMLDNIRNKARKIKLNLPAVNYRANSPVKILYEQNWRPENIVSVEIAYGNIPKPTTLMRIDRTTLKQRKNTGQINQMYKKVKEVKVVHNWVRRICKANNELWGIFFHCQLVIHNEDFEVLQTNDLHGIYSECATSMTFCSIGKGSVVVAHDNNGGLQEYNMEGRHMAEIQGVDGGYSDVFCDKLNGKLYALMYSESPSVLGFVHVDGSWVIESQTPVAYRDASRYDRVWVHQDKIYISSDKNDCIFAFNTDGKLLWQAGESGEGEPGKLGGPDLSNIDSEGNILVADHNKNRLQLYNPDTRTWTVLKMDEGPVDPIQAVVGEGGNHIWVATRDSFIKYSKV